MKNEITVLNYLLRTWYDEKHWLLSVRRSAVKMALRRTTVFVEAYRSVLKLLNPQSYTSSCYLVIHIIDVRLMPKFENDFDQLRNGTKIHVYGDIIYLNGRCEGTWFQTETTSLMIMNSSFCAPSGFAVSSSYAST